MPRGKGVLLGLSSRIQFQILNSGEKYLRINIQLCGSSGVNCEAIVRAAQIQRPKHKSVMYKNIEI